MWKKFIRSHSTSQLVGAGQFTNIYTCSEEHSKEFIRQIWKLSKQKDKNNSKMEKR